MSAAENLPQGLVDAALAYAAEGVPVFPCKESNKRPYTAHGFKEASTDAEQIRRWWAQWPGAMIGMPTGSRSGVWVLDVDEPETFERACPVSLPATRRGETGKGYHLHFAYREEIRNAQRGANAPWPIKQLPGAEVRGEGGYVILPPSRHPSGRFYRWANDNQPASAPAELVAIVTAPRGKAKRPSIASAPNAPTPAGAVPSPHVDEHRYALAALEGECEAIRCAVDGGQEGTLNKAALKIGGFVGGGFLRYETARTRLIAAGLQMPSHNPTDPWTPENVIAKVDRALRDGMATPKGVPDAPSEPLRFDTEAIKESFRMKSATEGPRPLFRELAPSPAFPIEALGSVLGNAARAIEQIVQLPLSSAANSVLAVASLAAQGRANVVLPVGNGTPRPLSLFFLTVLASGDRKSTADGIALRPVREFERELKEIQGKEQQKYEVEYAAFDTYSRSLKKKLASNKAGLEEALTTLGPAPRPPLSSVIAPSGDQTMEGLFRIYEHGRPSLAMLCDDAGTFLGGHSMKADQKKSTTGNLCRAWDGSKIERIRGGDGVKDLYDRRLAMHLMAQKDVAAEFLSDDRFADQGLLARFLITAPDSCAGTRFRDDAQYQADMPRLYAELRPYETAIAALIRKPIEWKDELNPALGIHLDSITLTSEARTLWVEFYNEIEGRQRYGGDLSGIKEFASKLLENATRLAGVLALCEDPAAYEIRVDALTDAIELARFYLAETLRMMGASYVNPELRSADAVRQWLHERGEITVGLSTIYQSGPVCVRDAQSARAAMSILANHGWVKQIPGGAMVDGKKHREAYEVETEA